MPSNKETLNQIAEKWKDKIFCPAPFLNAYINVNNKALRPCCMTPAVSRLRKPLEEGQELQQIQNDFWTGKSEPVTYYPGTGETLVDIRKKFLNNEWPEACTYCKVAEENQNWFDSVRIGYIHKYANYFGNDKLDNLHWHTTLGTEEYRSPIDVDLRPGNTCNFKCLTCSSIWSNSWQKEIDNNPELKGSYHDQESRSGNVLRQPPNWDSDEYSIYNTFDLSQVKWLKISGGESLIDNNVYRIFNKFIENDTAKDTTLQLITNCSKLPKRMKKVLLQFKAIKWRFSIDATHEVAEYVRYGTKWNETEKIIHELISMPNTNTFGFNTVLSMYNIFDIKRWMTYTYQMVIQSRKNNKNIAANFTHPHRLVEPRYMSISMLDDEDKEFIRTQWNEFVEENNVSEKARWPFNSVEDEFKVDISDEHPFENEPNKKYRSKNRSQNLKEFREKTLIIDKIRNTNVLDVVPRLKKYI